MGLCVGVSPCALRAPLHNSINPFSIGLGQCKHHNLYFFTLGGSGSVRGQGTMDLLALCRAVHITLEQGRDNWLCTHCPGFGSHPV